jgi:hypothetical protein
VRWGKRPVANGTYVGRRYSRAHIRRLNSGTCTHLLPALCIAAGGCALAIGFCQIITDTALVMKSSWRRRAAAMGRSVFTVTSVEQSSCQLRLMHAQPCVRAPSRDPCP